MNASSNIVAKRGGSMTIMRFIWCFDEVPSNMNDCSELVARVNPLHLSHRYALLPRHQQQSPAVGQQRRQEETRSAAHQPHWGGSGQHPQRALPQGPHAVARRPALLHRLPGQPHVLLTAVSQPGPVPARPQHAVGLLRQSQTRPDRHGTARYSMTPISEQGGRSPILITFQFNSSLFEYRFSWDKSLQSSFKENERFYLKVSTLYLVVA